MENNFDKSYRDKLSSHPSSMDLNKFWSDLEPKLPPKKKKRRIIFWFLFGFVLVGGLVVYILSNDNADVKQIEQRKIIHNETPSDQNVQIGQQTASKEFTFSPDARHNAEIENTENTSKSISEEKINRAGIPSVQGNPGVKNQKHGTTKSKLVNAKTNKENSTNESIALRSNANAVKHNQLKKVERIVDKQPENIIAINRPALELNINDYQAQKELSKKQISPDQSQYATPDSPAISIDSHEIKDSMSLSNGSLPSKAAYTEKLSDTTELILSTALIYKKKKTFNFFVRHEFFYGTYFKSIVTKDNRYESYAKWKQNTLSKLESWTAASLFGVKRNRWKVETGIQYHQMNEKFEYFEKKDINGFGNVFAEIQYANGSVDSVLQEAWYIRSVTRHVRHYNTIQQWNIPLIFSIDLLQRKSFSCGLSSGLLFSIKNKMKGRSIDDKLSISDINNISISKPNATLGLGFSAAAYFQYQLNSKFSVNTRLQYQFFSRSYIQGPVHLYYQNIGIGLGLEYSF